MNDREGQHLHDRATRGQKLTNEEREQLEAWYSKMDQAETQSLKLDRESSEDLLSAGIEKTLIKIAEAAEKIRELNRRTHELEQENAALRLRLNRHSQQHA